MLGAALAPVQAQETVPDSPAELRSFELKPSADLKATIEREPKAGPPTDFPVPAPAERSAAPAPAAPQRIDPGPPPIQAPAIDVPPAPARSERSAQPARRSPVPAPPPGASNSGAAEFIASPGIPGADVAAAPLPPSDVPSEESAGLPERGTPAAEAAPADTGSGLPWLNILLAGLAALALAFGISQRRRAVRARVAAEEAEQAALEADERLRLARAPERPQPQPAVKAEPAPRPVPAAAMPPPPPAPSRPWIELEFKPETAAANDVQAQLLYSLIVRNKGSLPALNVRIAARMFNIEAERSPELPQFFAAPIGQPSFPPRVIAPGEEVALRSTLVMPRSDVRAIVVQERKLFIPLAAFNTLYEWEGGESGQTAMSYVVGREAETPTQKMGPFRLDLGPRIYRSVGQRPSELARVA